MDDRGLHRIEEELGESWLERWLQAGLEKLDEYLANHAAFLAYLEGTEQPS